MRIYNEILSQYTEIEIPVKRIVSLSSGLTEALYMMGLGDLIVGTDAFSNKPTEARRKAKVGSYTHVNIELLKSLEPDIIFTITGVQRGIIEILRREGLTVYPLPMPTDVAGIIANTSLLGYATGYIDKARGLVSRLYRGLLKIIEDSGRRTLSILVVLDFGPRGGLWSPGGASHISDAIHLLGGISITGEKPVSYIETREAIAGVDAIDLVIYENSSYITSEEPIGYNKMLEMLRAGGVRYKRAIAFQEEVLAHTGPSFILDSMQRLRKIFNEL